VTIVMVTSFVTPFMAGLGYEVQQQTSGATSSHFCLA